MFQTVTDEGEQKYVVLPDGVAKVNDTTAAALRATNSYGLGQVTGAILFILGGIWLIRSGKPRVRT